MEKKNLVELKNNLTFVIQNQAGNMKLISAINDEFASKGFDISIPYMLFERQTQVECLTDNELLALSKSMYLFFTNSIIEVDIKVDINPNNFFEDFIISQYELMQPQKEVVNHKVVFEECREIKAGKDYWVYLTAEQLVELNTNRNVKYFEGIQRISKIETLPSGLKIKRINVNKNGIIVMRKRFQAHNLRPTSIALALLEFEGKNPKVQFVPQFKHTGRLSIEVNFDRNSDNYAPLIIPDGKHRFDAICDALKEDKTVKNEGLGVHIYFMTEKEAKQYVVDVFERNDTPKEYTDTLKDNANNRFIDNVIDNSDILRTSVSPTFTECKKLNQLSYRNVLNDCSKFTEIDLKNEIQSARQSIKIANIIDLLINYLKLSYFGDDLEIMKKHKFLLKCNMFVGYIAIANVIKDKENYKMLVGDIADKLITIDEDLNASLKLSSNVKKDDVEKIYKYFENLAKEIL